MDVQVSKGLLRPETSASETAAVEAVGIEKRYREVLFSPVSFLLAPSAALGVTGRNGSGKSTLLDIIAGVARPDAGTVRVNGQTGYVMQRDGLSGLLSCRENLLFEAALCRLPRDVAVRRTAECAALCGADGFLNKRLARCSAGMRQRVNIAAALLCAPAVLLLDEAFSSLDAQTARDLRAVFLEMKRGGTALIVVSHDSGDLADLCDRVLELPDAVVRGLP
jgi:ABC-type multidrug transport system ATPase subunit